MPHDSGIKRPITAIDIAAVTLILVIALLMCSGFVHAEDNGLPADFVPSDEYNRDLSGNTGGNRYGIPWHQYKNILTSETVEGQDVTVTCEADDEWSDPEAVSGLRFRLYNSTTQETESYLESDQNGVLHLPRMKRGHTYILMTDSDEYLIEGSHNIYLWALAAGDQGVADDGAYDHKTNYIRLEEDDPVPDNYLIRLSNIMVKYSPDGFYDPQYFSMNIPVEINGAPAPDGIRFRLTGDEVPAIEAVTRDGKLRAELTEDTDYTVHAVDDTYDIETFALAVKDKSEHKYIDTYGAIETYDRYTYDHTCCQGMNTLKLRKKSAVSHSGSITSRKLYNGTDTPVTTVTGMDFKTLLLLVRFPSAELPANSGVGDHDVVELTLANPHRWEKCKITETEFTVTQMLPQQRTVENVYLLTDGKLEKLSFSQKSKSSVVFTMDSMSLYPVVIEYADKEPESAVKPAAPAVTKVKVPKGTTVKKLKAGKKKITVIWKKQTKYTTGYQIQYSTKKNFKKAKTVTVKGAKKTKATIRKLKSKKKYYVRIRTYRKVNGKTYRSSWSKAKRIKVK